MKSWLISATTIAGVGLGIVAFISPEYRNAAIVVIVGITIFNSINELSTKQEKSDNELIRLHEKLKIHEQLIDLKAEMQYLKKVKK